MSMINHNLQAAVKTVKNNIHKMNRMRNPFQIKAQKKSKSNDCKRLKSKPKMLIIVK